MFSLEKRSTTFCVLINCLLECNRNWVRPLRQPWIFSRLCHLRQDFLRVHSFRMMDWASVNCCVSVVGSGFVRLSSRYLSWFRHIHKMVLILCFGSRRTMVFSSTVGSGQCALTPHWRSGVQTFLLLPTRVLLFSNVGTNWIVLTFWSVHNRINVDVETYSCRFIGWTSDERALLASVGMFVLIEPSVLTSPIVRTVLSSFCYCHSSQRTTRFNDVHSNEKHFCRRCSLYWF